MDAAAKKMTRSISRQLSSGAARLWRQLSLDPHTPRRGGPGPVPAAGAGQTRFAIARQSSLDPTPRGGPDGSSAHQQLAPAADAKHYGHFEVYNTLRARGAKVPGTYLAKWYGSKVFVKILDKDSFSDAESINAFKHELTLLEKARHPNLVQFVGAVTQNVPMMIVSEYHQKGDLASYIEMKGRLKPHKAIRFALDIARGLNYLHECKPEPIIHGNLSPKNIIRDDEGQLKVAGFGSLSLSKVSEDKVQMAQPVTKFDNVYIAPEVYKNEPFDRSVDVFAFGLILYEMIEGAPAFHPKPQEEAAKMICLEGLRPPFKNKPKYYPSDVKELIQECWDPMPSVRPTFAEIIVRLNKIHANCAKQGSWRDTFKLPWYISYHLSIISCQSPVQLLFKVLPVWPFPTIASPF
ncbi:Integrin-linked protein kinase family [Zea mays]|uniref:non-specific serine/threonine protein kinase n=1 Tax=Zea mays TaxID=4577 RepID=A0A1D6HCR7_MAIZE|nr:Integrin-linked protein kinase family [Zea mays]